MKDGIHIYLLSVSFLFVLVGCHDTGPDPIDIDDPIDTMQIDTMPMDTMPMDTMPMDTMPIDTMTMDTIPIDTIDLDSLADINQIRGDYQGICYSESHLFNSATGIFSITHDTLYNRHPEVLVDVTSNGDFLLTVIGGNSFLNEFYFSPDKFKRDTLKDTRYWGGYRTDLTIIRPDSTMISAQRVNYVSTPSYSLSICYYQKK